MNRGAAAENFNAMDPVVDGGTVHLIPGTNLNI